MTGRQRVCPEKETHLKRDGCSQPLWGCPPAEKCFRLVGRFTDVCDFSTLQVILYYECSRRFNIYNWFLRDLLVSSICILHETRKCIPISVCQQSGVQMLRRKKKINPTMGSLICYVWVTFWYLWIYNKFMAFYLKSDVLLYWSAFYWSQKLYKILELPQDT